MPLRYSIYWFVRCDHPECAVETETMLDATKVTADAEEEGWVTPDGLTWYCREHGRPGE